MAQIPRVFIIGGGFAGIRAARALDGAPCEVTLVDRRNHHVFQPLLYQVATASLSPADIAVPIRRVLRHQENCRVVLAKITGVNLEKKQIEFARGSTPYDYLILATGASHSYFGHDEWCHVAPGLKSIEDAVAIRRRILLAFESAEYEGSPERRRAALTFAIVGGGPTGVELAGAIKEIAAQTIPRDFRYIDTTTTRVVLFQGGDRLLPSFPQDLSDRAKRDLEAMGVEIKLGARVTNITHDGVTINDKEFLPVRTVFWAAGVKANKLAATLGVPTNKAGCVIVGPDLTVPNHPEVFVVGDLAAATSADTKKPVPGVAQAAMQMGHYAGTTIARELTGRSSPAERKPFVYNDKGSLATIGKARAVAELGKLHFGGFIAWLLWAVVHIAFLIGFRNRIAVMFQWIMSWTLNARDARLITGDANLDIKTPRPGELILAAEPTQVGSQTITPTPHAPNNPAAPPPPAATPAPA